MRFCENVREVEEEQQHDVFSKHLLMSVPAMGVNTAGCVGRVVVGSFFFLVYSVCCFGSMTYRYNKSCYFFTHLLAANT